MDELRSVARESRNLMDSGWYTVPFLRAFIDEDDAMVFEYADAAYIAAASPDVILGLLDRIDHYRRAFLEIATAAGDDTSDITHPDQLVQPSIEEFALRAVRDLHDSYSTVLRDWEPRSSSKVETGVEK